MPGPLRPARSSSRALRLLLGPTLALTLVTVGLAGCGGDDEAAPTTTAATSTTEEAEPEADPVAERIGQKVANSDDVVGVTSEMQTCVGERFLEEFDEEQALAVAEKADDDSDALTEDETAVLVDALNECIDGSVYSESFLIALYGEVGLDDGPEDEVVECLSDTVDGRVGTLAEVSDSTGELPPEFSAALDECIPVEVVGAIVAAGLAEPTEDGTQLSQSQIDCIVAQVESEISFSQLVSQDPAAADVIRTALLTCPAG